MTGAAVEVGEAVGGFGVEDCGEGAAGAEEEAGLNFCEA